MFGRSFFIAGAMMSLIALPLVVGSTREALQAIPSHVREASYALGKDRTSTVRRVLIPGARSGIATGATLGMGRIAGDTAIVIILLGATLDQSRGSATRRCSSFFKGTGSTLTSYVYNNSPSGEGGAPEKAYAAAFVLLRDRHPAQLRRRPDRPERKQMADQLTPPPPVRRIVLDGPQLRRRGAAGADRRLRARPRRHRRRPPAGRSGGRPG